MHIGINEKDMFNYKLYVYSFQINFHTTIE